MSWRKNAALCCHGLVYFLALVFPLQAGNGLNDFLGIQLWGGRSLWEDVAGDTAARLRLAEQNNQSQNEGASSGFFRANLDAARPLRVMGARVYSLEIYSANRKVTRVVLGFVNRADLIEEMSAENKSGKADPNSGQFLSAFEMRLAREREQVFSSLRDQMEKRLGQAAAGTDSQLRQWTWEDNILSLENAGLALTLRIEPRAAGRETAAASSASRTDRVQGKSNGDRILSGIPPISQGPRGFCVPASWEKCLRFHGLNLDVYQLGERGGTDYNGSFFIPFAARVAPLLAPKHFKMQLIKREALGLDLVKTYIDQASPLIWSMDAKDLPYWVLRSRKRASFLNDQAEGLPVLNPSRKLAPPAGHALLIVGYNSSLKEVALSDSTELGSGEGEIWIREKDLLEAAMPDGLVAVLPENSRLLQEGRFSVPASAGKMQVPSGKAPEGKKWY